jgi:hypothetical protein
MPLQQQTICYLRIRPNRLQLTLLNIYDGVAMRNLGRVRSCTAALNNRRNKSV